MLGAIIGDVVGSRYEFKNNRSKLFVLLSKACRFTDDSVLTIAVAKTLLDNYPIDYSDKGLEKIKKELINNVIDFVSRYPDRGYGMRFFSWATSMGKHEPYNSYGNGSAMRVSPVGWLANSIEEVKTLAKLTAEITHNHPEGIKGAEAIALCIFLARQGKTKEEIKEYIYEKYYPELDYFNYEELKKTNEFNETCQGSVPEAIYCFLISKNFEDAIKTAISIGGDSDTIACMAGSIAEAYYKNDEGLPQIINDFDEKQYLPKEYVEIVNRFLDAVGNKEVRLTFKGSN